MRATGLCSDFAEFTGAMRGGQTTWRTLTLSVIHTHTSVHLRVYALRPLSVVYGTVDWFLARLSYAEIQFVDEVRCTVERFDRNSRQILKFRIPKRCYVHEWISNLKHSFPSMFYS